MNITQAEMQLLQEIKERTQKNINVQISQNTKTGDFYIKEISKPIKI